MLARTEPRERMVLFSGLSHSSPAIDRPSTLERAVEKEMKRMQFPFAFRMIQQYLNCDMFDAIKAQLTTAGEKLAHMRRFL